MKNILQDNNESEKKTVTLQTSPSSVSSPSPSIILSKEDAYIRDLLASQPKTLDEIEVKVLDKEDPNNHRLSLPEEIKRYEDRFVFRWIYRDSKGRAISEATQLKGWVLVNRSYFPDVPNHMFTTNGVIERGDNILAFIPRKIAEDMRKKPIQLSKEMVQSRIGAHAQNPNFYVPTDKSEEGEKSRVVGI